MDFSDKYLGAFAIAAALAMGGVAAANWLNRRHGGFVKGWAGAIFIGICWTSAMLWLLVRVRVG